MKKKITALLPLLALVTALAMQAVTLSASTEQSVSDSTAESAVSEGKSVLESIPESAVPEAESLAESTSSAEAPEDQPSSDGFLSENLPAEALSMAGGWMTVADPAEADAAFESFKRATEDLDGCLYEAVSCLGTREAEGTNYCILARLTYTTATPVSHYALVYIRRHTDGSADITKIADLDLAGLSQ